MLALISTYDKANIVEFAQKLNQLNVTILSTGGSKTHLMNNGITVTDVSSYTGFPEIMDGRVKTLHPKIHGGILGRPGIDDAIMQELNIQAIEIVVVNLYPFQKVIAEPDCDHAKAIENIDIGGPTLVRAAAKNYAATTIIIDPNDYDLVADELTQTGKISLDTRYRLAAKAFAHVAEYDIAIANYFQANTLLPETFNLNLHKKIELRYGENPHQKAAFYTNEFYAASLASAELKQGKPLSFNNLTDAHAALSCVKSFPAHQSTCVIVKHGNPCGVAVGEDPRQAYELAYGTDPTSSFGGIIAFNQTLDAAVAQLILDNQFVEIILAPRIDDQALPILEKKPNVRVLEIGDWYQQTQKPQLHIQSIDGGILIQETDNADFEDLNIVTQHQPDPTLFEDLKFAWRVAKFVKSNAIILAKNNCTLGIGAGQMSRIDSVKIAAMKAENAGLTVSGCVLASDAFFPFSDTIEMAQKLGVRAIIQPGGSIRDEEVIAAANQAGIAMIFTGMRHFKH